jgi:PKD repeat protein
MHKRVNGQKIANIVGIVIILSMMLAVIPSGLAPVTAAPPQSPPPGPTAQNGVAYTLRIHGTGWSRPNVPIEGDSRAGDKGAVDPVLGTLPEDPPYTEPLSVFDPEGPQAPSRDSVTFNPVWMYEGATRDENWAKGLYQQILTPINASEKVWLRMWYEPEHWDKDLNGNQRLDIAAQRWDFEPTMPVTDVWYPALMQEFTYLLMEGKQLTAEPPPFPTWGNVGTSFVFPVGMKYEDLFTPSGAVDMGSANAQFGYGLTSLDGNFDGVPDIVHVESELSLYGLTSIAADFDGDGLVEPLDVDGTSLNGNELAVLRLGAKSVDRGKGIQFLDHLAMVEQVSDNGVQLGIYYTGDLTPRPFPSITLQIGDMVLAGSQGPAQLIRAVRNGGTGTNMTRFPTGPWFVYLQGVDRDENQAILIVGRAVGATHSAMEDGMYREDRRPGDPWFLKRFYVDGHEYNVVALMTRNGGGAVFGTVEDLDANNDGFIDPAYDPFTFLPDRTQFQFITLRTPIPKTNTPVRIAQHSVWLQNYLPGDNLSVLPPYNYEHYYIQDINAIQKFSEFDIWDPVQQRWEISVKSVGRLVGPVPPILQKNKTLPYVGYGPNSPYTDARETSLYYVEEDKNPQFLGMLRELYSEREDGGQYWSTRQFMTVPWWYTDVVFPDVREAIHGQGNPDLYLLKSVFFNYQSERRYWLRTAVDWADLLGIAEPPVPIMFWFDPAVGGKKYKDTEGLRIYGELIYGEPVLGEMQDWTWPDGILGNKGAGDVLAYLDRLAPYPVEVLPYTDPLAPFDPDHPQAPRKDFVTLNPAYMNEYDNGGEPLVDLYRQISIREGNAGEKVFFRMWYEPTYVDKIVRADIEGTVITPTEVMTFPAVMQEFTYMYLDMNDQPSSGQPGKSVFAFPIATGANELPKPVGGSLPGALLPSLGYGLTTFDANFDGVEDTVTIHSEATLQQATGIGADFNGDGAINNLDTDGTPLSGDELVVFAMHVYLQRGQSAQLLDHMVSLANIGGTVIQPSADLTLWYTGGGMHANNSMHPDLVPGSPVTLREREMAIVDRAGYRRILAGGNNLNGLNGAWFVYVDQINSATETVNLIIGRALGATHSAIDDGAGAHDLVAGDPWYLKRFFVDGHEYNVVALMTVPNTYGYPNEDRFEFKYITIRTPVPKPEDFDNYEDSQILQGYGIGSVISVMPPFNYQHTVREDVLAMPETWNNPNPQVIPVNRTELTLGNPAYMERIDPECIGRVLAQRPPLRIQIVDEAREPQFFGELKELYYIAAGPTWRWMLTEFRSSPDKYTELRFPAGEKYLLTTDWWWYNLRADFECTQYLPPIGAAQMQEYRVMFWYDPTDPKDIYINTTTACDAPQANFSATPTQGLAPLTVNFTNLSVGDITSWSWNFGDGGTSNLQNPTHVYNNPGAYTVSLTVSGPCGVDTETKIEYIVVTSCALIRVSPLTQTVGVRQTVAVDIRVEGVSNLYGVDIQLSFDYTRVQVVDDDPATPGIQITPGPFLNPASGYVQTNSANNGTGVVRYTFTLQNPAPPANGSGVVATIHFTGLSTGTANLAFTLGQLVDRYGTQLCSTTQGGSLEVVITTGSISGTVSLQSRTNHSGVSVAAGALPPVSTGTNGTFTIAGVPPATYTVIASKDGYLSARKTGVVVPPSGAVNIGNVMLLGGDANNDGLISIVDLVIVGAMYGSTPPADGRADINGDGTCNLVDLVLVGANYGKTGPTDWVMLAAAGVEAQSVTSKLSFSPSFRILPVGSTTTVEVVAGSVADLYAGELEISYDPAALSVVDMDANKEGIQISAGSVFAGSGAFVAVNDVDAQAGKIRFAATLLDPAPAIQGNVVLARITFKALKSGPSMLRFSNAQLLTPQASALNMKVNDGSLWLGPIRGITSEPDFKVLGIQ